MSKKITLQDIAKTAGVAVGTVHKAIHGQTGVSKEKRAKILEIAVQLGYSLQSSPNKSPVRVAAVFPKPVRQNKYFYKPLWNGLRDRAVQLTSAQFYMEEYMFEGGTPQQLELLEQVYRERSDQIQALITIIWNESAYADLIDRFTDAGVQVYTVSADAPNSRRICTVRTNPERTGRLAAEFLAPRLADEGRVILIGTRRDTINHAQIVHGFFDEMMERAPNLEIIELYESLRFPDKLYQTMMELIHSFDSVRAIYANNARATAGLCNVLAHAEIPTDIQLLGSECFPESVALLRNGRLAGLIDQNAYMQGYRGLTVVFDHLVLGKEVSPLYEIAPTLFLCNSLLPDIS